MITKKIKNEYLNNKIYIAGILHEFSGLTPEQIEELSQNEAFNIYIEEAVSIDEETSLNPTEFEEALAKVGILTSNMTAKKLDEFKKKNNRK